MEFGLFTEFQCPPGMGETAAFDESMAQMTAAEAMGFDAVWLAELHFQKDRAVLASPLVVASALAARTRRIKLVTAVQVLPLSHPLRLAEDVATLDHLSKGRVEFGVGRSGLPGHYQGFNTTRETFPLIGEMGYAAFMAVRTTSIPDLQSFVSGYHEAWASAGHAGRGTVALSVPLYVADTAERAREEPEPSTMHFFRSISRALQQRSGAAATMQTGERAELLGSISYDDVLDRFAVFGTPEAVADRLLELRERVGFTSLAAWMNPGGLIPNERVLRSMQLFAERVIPRLA
jgi:alkanesulfonate monooxygenase SsuD/methylene tetrahydromethanopterin reductase-like flavin-dependent oxidoreductase (luciferase family)